MGDFLTTHTTNTSQRPPNLPSYPKRSLSFSTSTPCPVFWLEPLQGQVTRPALHQKGVLLLTRCYLAPNYNHDAPHSWSSHYVYRAHSLRTTSQRTNQDRVGK